jgi:hypothetical protein
MQKRAQDMLNGMWIRIASAQVHCHLVFYSAHYIGKGMSFS